MKLTVYRYKVRNPKDDSQLHMPPYYAIREYIEELVSASVIEEDFLKVDESDLDVYGRISAN